jgi:hypothetical protein
MGRMIRLGDVETALAWLDPARDTQLARLAAKRALDQGWQLRCVWTGARLGPGMLDIDHCLPWSAWPCGDLWNLLPASPRVNQHLITHGFPTRRCAPGSNRRLWPLCRSRLELPRTTCLPGSSGGVCVCDRTSSCKSGREFSAQAELPMPSRSPYRQAAPTGSLHRQWPTAFLGW